MELIIRTPEMSNIPEIELIYLSGSTGSPTPLIKTPDDACNAFKEKWDHLKINLLIECKIMLVDNAGKALGIYTVSSGGRSTAGVDRRLIFAAALKCAAAGLFICVNHPAGTLIPSREEIQLCEKVKAAGILLDIRLHDFLIISNDGYYSFSDKGNL